MKKEANYHFVRPDLHDSAVNAENEVGHPRKYLHELIDQIRSARRLGSNAAVRDASKLLQKELRAIAKARKSSIIKVL